MNGGKTNNKKKMPSFTSRLRTHHSIDSTYSSPFTSRSAEDSPFNNNNQCRYRIENDSLLRLPINRKNQRTQYVTKTTIL